MHNPAFTPFPVNTGCVSTYYNGFESPVLQFKSLDFTGLFYCVLHFVLHILEIDSIKSEYFILSSGESCIPILRSHAVYPSGKSGSAIPICPSKYSSIILSTRCRSCPKVWVYTFFITVSVFHPPRSWAYLSGTCRRAMTEALTCLRS